MKHRLVILICVVALVAMSAFAQDNTTHTLTFNGFTFQYAADFATNVNIMQDPGYPPLSEYGNGTPAYTLYLMYDRGDDPVFPNPVPESAWDATGGVMVFNTADFAAYDEVTTRFEALQSLLAERSDLSVFETADTTLPYIPVYAAAQTFRAQAHYVDTAQLQGIAYITMYQEAAEPFLKDSLYYTFQGISVDGAHYVTMIIPLETNLLPESTDATFDYTAFVTNLNDYLAQTMADIDAASSSDFNPALDQLDALVQTLVFDSITTP